MRLEAEGRLSMTPVIIIAAIVLVVVGFIWTTYNRLVSLRVQVGEAWSDIDVQLRRRYDLVPNLVETVKVKGMLEIRCMKPNGVKIIKESFLNAKKAEKTKDADVRFYVIAAPKYSVEVLAENYKRAEEVIQKVAQSVVSNVVKAGGQGTFRREK